MRGYIGRSWNNCRFIQHHCLLRTFLFLSWQLSLFSSWLLPVTLRSHLPTQVLPRSCAAFLVAFCFSWVIARRRSLSLASSQPICHPTLCLLSLPREASLLFLNRSLLSCKKPSKLSSRPSLKVSYQCPFPSSRSSRPRKLPTRFSDFILEWNLGGETWREPRIGPAGDCNKFKYASY
jgi:hypothetical protein